MKELDKMIKAGATFTELRNELMDLAATADDLWGRIMSWSMEYNISLPANPLYPEIAHQLSELVETIYQLTR